MTSAHRANGQGRRCVSTEKGEHIAVVATRQFDALEKAGAISEWYNVKTVQVLMDNAQAFFDCKWWVVFAVAGVSLRVAFMPVSFLMLKSGEKMKAHAPRLKELSETIKSSPPGSQAFFAASQEQQQLIFSSSPMFNKSFLSVMVLQILLTSTTFIATRSLSTAAIPSMMDGGIFPYHDLTISSTFLAQISGGLVGMNLLAAFLINRYYGNTQKLLLFLAPLSYLGMVWIGGSLPAGVMYSFIASNCFGSLWTVISTVAPFRRAMGLSPIGPGSAVQIEGMPATMGGPTKATPAEAPKAPATPTAQAAKPAAGAKPTAAGGAKPTAAGAKPAKN